MKLPASWTLPTQINSRFGQRSIGKQRAMIAEGHLLLILHQAPQPDDQTRTGALFWRKPTGEWEHHGGAVGIQPLVKHLEQYNIVEEALQTQYDQAQIAEDYFRILEAIAPLRLAAKNSYAALQSAREGIPDDRDILDLRDWASDIERNLDLLYENAKNALDFKIAQRAEEQTRLSNEAVVSGHRLNVLAAVFLPLTAIASIFGMNVNNGLESTPVVLFWLVALMAIGLGLLVRQWVVTGRWRG